MSTIPSFSQRLWSEEVGLANADQLPPTEVAYCFSNGREFRAIDKSAFASEDPNGAPPQE